MEFFDLKNWDINQDTLGGLLFVQRLHEMSFDYTSYLHKGNRPTCRQIVLECLTLVNFYRRFGHLSYHREIEILREELLQTINIDPVAKSLIGMKKELYLGCLNEPDNLDNITNCLQLIDIRVQKNRYLNECINQLKLALKTSKEKKKIICLTERFYLSCIEGGYQNGTIYFLVRKYFFDKKTRHNISTYQDVADFFDYFDLKVGKYSVVFKGPKIFYDIKDSCNAFDIELLESVHNIVDCKENPKFCDNKRGKSVFVKCGGVRAVDYLAARQDAESRMTTLSNILNLFHHKRNVRWGIYAAITHEEKKQTVIIKRPNNPMVNIPDHEIESANRRFLHIIKEIRLKKDSFKRFNRALGFHSLASKINDPANQLVNLWTCIEIILVGNKKGSKIDNIEKALAAFVTPAYIPYLLSEITTELREWNDKKFADLAKRTEQFEKNPNDLSLSSAELFTLKEHEEIVTNYLADMDTVPLLRQKVMFFVENLQNTKHIIKVLDQFEDRLLWDIRRIYRSRNMIVHSGLTPRDINIFIQVAHTFLDIIFSNIYRKSAYLKNINTIENTIVENSLSIKSHKEILKNQIQCNKDNFLELLFGPDTAKGLIK